MGGVKNLPASGIVKGMFLCYEAATRFLLFTDRQGVIFKNSEGDNKYLIGSLTQNKFLVIATILADSHDLKIMLVDKPPFTFVVEFF